MNERIKKLASQCYELTKPDLNERFNKEKFAELIIRECMDIALKQKKWVEDQKVFNDHDEQWNRARIQQSQHIVVKIREHFGVE